MACPKPGIDNTIHDAEFTLPTRAVCIGHEPHAASDTMEQEEEAVVVAEDEQELGPAGLLKTTVEDDGITFEMTVTGTTWMGLGMTTEGIRASAVCVRSWRCLCVRVRKHLNQRGIKLFLQRVA